MSDPVTRLNAVLEGRYRIGSKLGEGGMATVYLAEDQRHARNVALKVLKPELAALLGAERFLAEIRTTANLQHPHILPLFDSGEADGFLFYVMPYVDGESLRDKLDRETQVGVDEAVRIATHIADALDYAHRHGVIHRDIKPANILLHEGNPVVADFGIALAVTAAGGGRMTETGLSLGTPHYMSPEQATGEREVDPRSDVYALGCVLYEMLVGQPPFSAPSARAVLTKILTETAPLVSAARPTVPRHVVATVHQALQRIPADRVTSAGAFGDALREPDRTSGIVLPGEEPPAASGPRRSLAHSGILALLPWAPLAVVVIALGIQRWAGTPSPSSPTPIQASLDLPPNTFATAPSPAISHDGTTVAIHVSRGDSTFVLVRRLDEPDFELVDGTVNPNLSSKLALSPDGAWIAYADGERHQVERVPTRGGAPLTLTSTPIAEMGGGDWTVDGTLYYAPRYDTGIWRVAVEGGAPEQLTTADPERGELGHWGPQLLPDGEHLLYTAYRVSVDSVEVAVVSLESGVRTTLVEGGFGGRFVPSGHLLFASEGALYAVPFDVEALSVTGPRVPMIQDLATEVTNYQAGFAISHNGTLVFLRNSELFPPSEAVWVDRGRRETTASLPPGAWLPALSPDEEHVAVRRRNASGVYEVLAVDLARGTPTRLSDPGRAAGFPMWGPEGEQVLFVQETPAYDVFTRSADGRGRPELVWESPNDTRPRGITPDGTRLLVVEYADTMQLVLSVALEPGPGPEVILTGPSGSLDEPRVSPDGRWLAYRSLESGREEVWIEPWGGAPGRRTQVSLDGGANPRWTRGGRELVFRNGDSGHEILAVSIDPTDGPVGTPTVLVEVDSRSWSYDVTADGERFLITRDPAGSGARRLVVVTGFHDQLRERVPPAGE